jgi:hypothetical protein
MRPEFPANHLRKTLYGRSVLSVWARAGCDKPADKADFGMAGVCVEDADSPG